MNNHFITNREEIVPPAARPPGFNPGAGFFCFHLLPLFVMARGCRRLRSLSRVLKCRRRAGGARRGSALASWPTCPIPVLAIGTKMRALLADCRPVGMRPEQLSPDGAWTKRGFYNGRRGAGKTRAGAEWNPRARKKRPGQRIALVASTRGRRTRDVNIEAECLRRHRLVRMGTPALRAVESQESPGLTGRSRRCFTPKSPMRARTHTTLLLRRTRQVEISAVPRGTISA